MPSPIEKTGVLIANLGTPDGTGYWAIRRYLSEFLSDPLVVDMPKWIWQPLLQLVILTKRPFSSGRAYASIWNDELDESPLLTITRAQSEKLAVMIGDEVEVDFCMRYGNPSTASKVKKLIDSGCTRILFFPLYPQHAGATTKTANLQFNQSVAQLSSSITLRSVSPYFERPDYIDALAKSVTDAYDAMNDKPEVLVASYHGLPQNHVDNGDPYYDHCIGTTELLRTKLGWSDETLISTFQSRFGAQEWIKPYTVKEVERLAQSGVKHIAVIAPAFASDCIETLEEIHEEIKDAFVAAGGEKFTYIPCLNDGDAHVAMMANVVRENLADWD